jgi:bifunctional DNA-binding transcriptional regulator/antitoxin component of YhaV-PrlF toxin-antitoxin module
MALVKMKEKFQLTVPSELRRRVKYAVGDLFEADVDADGHLMFTPKTLVDRAPVAKTSAARKPKRAA